MARNRTTHTRSIDPSSDVVCFWKAVGHGRGVSSPYSLNRHVGLMALCSGWGVGDVIDDVIDVQRGGRMWSSGGWWLSEPQAPVS